MILKNSHSGGFDAYLSGLKPPNLWPPAPFLILQFCFDWGGCIDLEPSMLQGCCLTLKKSSLSDVGDCDKDK